MEVLIIGGGITGLAAANRLKELNDSYDIDLKFKILESSGRIGGNISTIRHDDLLIEEGPDSFLTAKPQALDLCNRLGMESEIMGTSEINRKTLIYLDGRLVELPEGFILLSPTKILPFITSPIMSLSGKLRVLAEMFIPAANSQNDESLKSFITRRFGMELYENIAQPLIGGIYTSDPEKLSMKSAVPNIYGLQKKYGSIIKGLMKEYSNRKESGARYSQFVTLKNGMSTLINRIEDRISKDLILTGQSVKEINKKDKIWTATTTDGKEYNANGIILATPSHASAEIVSSIDTKLSVELNKIEFASSAIVLLAYMKQQIRKEIGGFGFVVPVKENLNIIACSLSSGKFEGRAPDDSVLLRCFVGGATNEKFLENSDEQIINTVKQELENILDITGQPYYAHMKRYPRSMPQYNVGHSEIVEKINKLISKHDNLELAGNSYNGVGIPDCIKSGEKAAEKFVNQLS